MTPSVNKNLSRYVFWIQALREHQDNWHQAMREKFYYCPQEWSAAWAIPIWRCGGVYKELWKFHYVLWHCWFNPDHRKIHSWVTYKFRVRENLWLFSLFLTQMLISKLMPFANTDNSIEGVDVVIPMNNKSPDWSRLLYSIQADQLHKGRLRSWSWHERGWAVLLQGQFRYRAAMLRERRLF